MNIQNNYSMTNSEEVYLMCIDLQGFGLQLQAIRMERNLTQEKLAELASLSPHYIGNLEQGVRRPSLGSVMQLCTALGTTPDQLFKDSISQEMLDGISIAVSKANTLRETMDVLSDLLSDMLPIEDEETPTLFGIPLHLIPQADAPMQFTSLADDLLQRCFDANEDPT